MKREQAAEWTGIVGGVVFLAGAVFYMVNHQWSTLVVGLLIAGALGIAVFFAMMWPEFMQGGGGRRLQEGANVALYTLLVLGVVAAINFIGYKHDKVFDFTKEKLNTLADESVKAAKQLREPVMLTGLFIRGQEPNQDKFEHLARLYEAVNAGVKHQIFDPQKEPQTAAKYNVTSSSTIYVESGPRRISVSEPTEEAMTNGLLQLSGEQKEVCFLVGHGERSPAEFKEEGYSDLSQALIEKNYKTRTLQLLKEQKSPEECAVVVIAGPKNNLLDGEMNLLSTHLDKGGKMIVMIDPFSRTNAGSLAAPFGVTFKNQLVLDPGAAAAGLSQQAPFVIGEGYNSQHDITRDLAGGTDPAVFLNAEPVYLADQPPPGVTLTWLLRTTPNSWAETDLTKSTAQYNPGVDPKGPLTLAAAVSKGDTRLIVIGNSEFLTNVMLHQVLANEYLFLNAIRWQVGEANLITIPPKNRKDQPLSITDKDLSWIGFLFVFALPGVFALSGITMWWRRRRL